MKNLLFYLKIIFFLFLIFWFLMYFKTWIKLGFYNTELANWESYKMYVWSFLWFSWIWPLNTINLGLAEWLNEHSIFYDVFKLSFINILKIFWNIFLFFWIFYLVFLSEIKDFFKWKPILNIKEPYQKFVKFFYLFLFFIIFLNFWLLLFDVILG